MTQKYVCDAQVFNDRGEVIKEFKGLNDVKINEQFVVFLSNGGKDGEMYLPIRGQTIKIQTRECPQDVELYQ